MARVLVTGGAGFIGSHITARLVDLGHQVRVIDDFSTGRRDNLESLVGRIDLLEADIRDPAACDRACQDREYVFHQAAIPSVPKSVEHPQASHDANVNGTFHLLDGGEITVPMMYQTESFGYNEGNGFQAVELPYDGRELSMVVLLPDAGNFEKFEDLLLDSFTVESIIRDIEYREVSLTIPEFEYESEFSLKKTLAAMGMPVAFTNGADFSGMTGNRDLYIAEVIHKAFVSVDEAGTEAAPRI